jgi:sulfoxide reductase heme-binding subunit YedZ
VSNTDPTQHLFWLASRGLGVIALVLVSVSVGLGLAMAARVVKGPGVPAYVKKVHEATALTALLAIAAHGVVLLGDSFLRPSLADLALPFRMAGQPAWTGVGIIGGWLAAILGLSFYVRRWIGPGLWRRMHRWTLVVWVLAVAHTLGSGSDAGSLWLLAIVGITAAPIVFLAALRMLPRPPKMRSPERPLTPPTSAPHAGPRALSP